MEFVETSAFAEFVRNELGEAGFRKLQHELFDNPTAGPVIRGSGGARKIRAGASRAGKSGSYRVIYYYSPADERCYMLLGFSKNETENLTGNQTRKLREYIKRHLK